MSNTRKENNNMRKLTGKAAILAAAICVAAALPSWAEAKSVTLTCSGYTGTTTLTDFQALVKLSDGVNGFRYADCATNDGTDLWFTDSSGNEYHRRFVRLGEDPDVNASLRWIRSNHDALG